MNEPKNVFRIKNGVEITANTRFIFHNVGQGLFYTGEIYFRFEDEDKVYPFIFVYDCGSYSPRGIPKTIKNAVKLFKKEVKPNIKYKKPKIDLLIISHFDTDHINGLKELFDNFEIDTVVIPYYFPIERLIFALTNECLYKWYYEFLSDPILFLLNKGVKRVVLVGRNDYNAEKDKKDDLDNIKKEFEGFSDIVEGKLKRVINIENRDIPRIYLDVIGESKNDTLEDYLKNNDEYGEEYYDKIIKKMIEEKKLILKGYFGCMVLWIKLTNEDKEKMNDYDISHIISWIFALYNHYPPNPEKTLKDFKKCINNILKDKNIKDAIKDENLREKIKRDCYEKVFGEKKLNDTSLILYHSPIILCQNLPEISKYEHNKDKYKKYIRPSDKNIKIPNKFAQLLTGDIDLKKLLKDKNVQKNIKKEILKNILNEIVVSLIPHHGSKDNWDSEIINYLGNCVFWVASGEHRRYKHPSRKVFKEIKSREGRYVVWVNKRYKFILRNEIKWHYEDIILKDEGLCTYIIKSIRYKEI